MLLVRAKREFFTMLYYVCYCFVCKYIIIY